MSTATVAVLVGVVAYAWGFWLGTRTRSDSVSRRRVRQARRELRQKDYRKCRRNGAGRLHAAIYAWASSKPVGSRW